MVPYFSCEGITLVVRLQDNVDFFLMRHVLDSRLLRTEFECDDGN